LSQEISELRKQDLIYRGAIFDEAAGEESASENLIPR
jgi:hypothetical protein